MLRQLVIAALLAAWSGSTQAVTRPKVPPGTWAVDYAKEYCILSRDGMPGEIGVAFRTRPLSVEHDLLFYTLASSPRKKWFKGRVIRADGTMGSDRWAILERSSGHGKAVLKTTITADELASTIASGSIRFTGEMATDMHVNLPNISKALDALRLCEDDLAKKWGVDPLEMRRWAKPAMAKSDLRELFWGKDPSRYGVLQSHHVRALLVINEAGRAVDCTIIEKSRVPWVNKQVCDVILKEAQFEPALNAAGKSVQGKVVTPRITSVRLR